MTCQTLATCTACMAGYYINGAAACIACTVADANALTCSSATVSTTCATGYTPSSGFCVQTSKLTGCSITTLALVTACATPSASVVCLTGYYATSANACVVCTLANAVCTSTGTFSSCQPGYF
jgi:hypothetical protein